MENPAIAVFKSLRSRKFPHLWDHQSAVLKRCTEFHKSDADIGIELPTGSGKSLVASVLAETARRAKSRVAILCGNRALTRQFATEVSELNIPHVLFEGEGRDFKSEDLQAYARAEAVGLMNYWVYFNSSPYVKPADVLIFDDAHLAEGSIVGMSELRVSAVDKAHKDVFKRLIDILARALPDLRVAQDHKKGSVSPVTPTDVVSYFDAERLEEKILEVLEAHCPGEDSLMWGYSFIKDRLKKCCWIIGPDEIVFRPYIPPAGSYGHFEKPHQRVYLSATLGALEDLQRRLGAPHIVRVEIEEEHQDYPAGTRLIGFVDRMADLSDDPAKQIQFVIAMCERVGKSLWLCSSHREATDVAGILSSACKNSVSILDRQGERMTEFRDAKSGHLVVAGRYEGMDFPDDACRMTAAVANTPNTALVFSLQSSKRESLEYVNLLQTVDHLAARKDQRREPVEGNEILSVIQRRLLAKIPDEAQATPAATVYQEIVTQMRRAYARSAAEQQQAEEDGLALRNRVRSSYPFHPALIDLMRERWAAIPDFQRTRGALRFLAACLRACHRDGKSRAVLGPGDVPMHDAEVRLAFFKEVGQQADFQAVLEHDLVGANARARRVDDRRAKEVPAEATKRPATRLATAILMYSFGGLRREGAKEAELLPPGVTEEELLRVCVGPDLDSTTAQACLKELKEQCLYLHFDGVRYCFKKDPNVTLLVEQEADAVARDERRVRDRIKEMLEARLAGHRTALVWPEKAGDVPDKDPSFLIAYLPLEFGGKPKSGQEAQAKDVLEKYGDKPRQYRNGLGVSVPSGDQIESLRRSVRYLVAVEQVKTKAKQHNLTDEQRGQLREREATEKAAAESAFLKLYTEVWLPRVEGGGIGVETVAVGGRPLQTTLNEKKEAMIHERVMELLTSVQPRLFSTLTPGKIIELFKLGEGKPPRQGARTSEIVEGFYSFLGFTRLTGSVVIRKAIARGVQEGAFGYIAGTVPELGADGRYQVPLAKVRFGRGHALLVESKFTETFSTGSVEISEINSRRYETAFGTCFSCAPRALLDGSRETKFYQLAQRLLYAFDSNDESFRAIHDRRMLFLYYDHEGFDRDLLGFPSIIRPEFRDRVHVTSYQHLFAQLAGTLRSSRHMPWFDYMAARYFA